MEKHTMHVKHDGSQEIGKVAMNAYHQKKAAEDKRQRKNSRRLWLVERGAFR